MSETCVVVADARVARFYGVEPVESPRVRARLVERLALANPDLRTLGRSASGRARTETNTNREAGPVHPMGAQRERHRVELGRRFGHEIAREAAAIARGWKEGMIVLVAEPQLLGLLREPLRNELPAGVELKELAKDYAQLSAAELRERLDLNRIVPEQRGGRQ